MSDAYIFPGQGSQFVGMGRDLYDSESVARAVFDEVDEALGEALSKTIFEGPEDDLRLTRNTQPALMAVSLSVASVLAERGFGVADKAAYVAGHSLGEYSALAAAGSLTITDAAKLLRLRGDAMQAAVPVGEGAMAALLGLDFDVAVDVAQEAASETEICAPANDNASGQVVVSGHKGAVERAIEIAKEKGAKRGVLLPVSAPFHCALMQPAADAMAEALAGANITAPVVPLIANVSASPTSEPEEIRSLLVKQVTGVVRWRESVASMPGLGVTRLIEVGAGKVLSGLARRIDRSLEAVSIQGPDDISMFSGAFTGE